MCCARGYGFLAVLVWNRVSILTILVWNSIWFVHSSLELGTFFRWISFFFIIWQWDHFPYNIYANYHVRAVTACHALQSRVGLQGFRSEIGEGFQERCCIPPPNFSGSSPPQHFCRFCARNGGSLWEVFLADTVETLTKNRCVMEATDVLWRKLRKD